MTTKGISKSIFKSVVKDIFSLDTIQTYPPQFNYAVGGTIPFIVNTQLFNYAVGGTIPFITSTTQTIKNNAVGGTIPFILP